jgi:hypothetical protein
LVVLKRNHDSELAAPNPKVLFDPSFSQRIVAKRFGAIHATPFAANCTHTTFDANLLLPVSPLNPKKVSIVCRTKACQLHKIGILEHSRVRF